MLEMEKGTYPSHDQKVGHHHHDLLLHALHHTLHLARIRQRIHWSDRSLALLFDHLAVAIELRRVLEIPSGGERGREVGGEGVVGCRWYRGMRGGLAEDVGPDESSATGGKVEGGVGDVRGKEVWASGHRVVDQTRKGREEWTNDSRTTAMVCFLGGPLRSSMT
jgi:hypothetical protein